MKLLDKEFEKYISELEIAERVSELAEEISENYANDEVLILSVLNGAFIFTADLIRNLQCDYQLVFVFANSYDGMESSGEVKTCYTFGRKLLQGKRVLILEDIIDTGNTLKYLLSEIHQQKPQGIEIASLLLKPDAYKLDKKIRFVGFNIPNDFVVGYGMDYNESGRNLKDIYILKHQK